MAMGQEQGGEPGGAPSASVALGAGYLIYPERPLPELRCGLNLTYQAVSRDRPKNDYLALICDPASLPRLETIAAVRKSDVVSLMTPLEWKTVDWPASHRRQLAIAYERPAGGRLVATLDETIRPIGEEEVIRSYLTPLAAALSGLSTAGIVHGSVNPSNLFFRDTNRRQIVLGDCVGSAVAMHQPGAFTPIEVALAGAPARGQGQLSDDVFGLGMTIAHLLLGANPAANIAEAELLRDRIERGSFSAILGDKRVPMGMIELLRGLLADDPKVRWTIKEIEEWIPARRLVTRQGASMKRAARPFDFDGHPYGTARALAHAFTGNVPAAAAAVRSRDFEIWVQRALSDENGTKIMKMARGEGGVDGQAEKRDDLLVSRVCVALDYLGPLRYRDLVAAVDGFGGALAAAFMGHGSIQTIAESIIQRVPQFWLSARSPAPTEHVSLFKLFEKLRLQIEDRRLGFGIERVLYDLNPTLHCLSPLLERECICSLAELLPALERRAAEEFGGSYPIDRHGAAFVASKFRNAANEWVDPLSSTDPSTKLFGTLRMLARLQAHSGPASVPALARWIGRQAGPLVEAYHHRPTRKRLTKELEAATQAGRLVDILLLIDNDEAEKRDTDGFAEAVRAHAIVVLEMQRLTREATRNDYQVVRLAGQMAASLGTILATAALFAAFLVLG